MIAQRLAGKPKDLARPNTLSSRHGLEAFPLHSDGALTATPPRWLLLVAPRRRITRTILFDTNKLTQEFGDAYLRRALFLQKSRHAKYLRLLVEISGRQCIRYNADVMQPANSEATAVNAYLRCSLPSCLTIDWQENRMALIDNWATLHARGPFLDSDGAGIFRFSIWSKNNDMDIGELLY